MTTDVIMVPERISNCPNTLTTHKGWSHLGQCVDVMFDIRGPSSKDIYEKSVCQTLVMLYYRLRYNPGILMYVRKYVFTRSSC